MEKGDRTLGQSGLFHNTGGPYSRVRSEQINSDLLEKNSSGATVRSYSVTVPDAVHDCHAWLEEISRLAGYRDLRHADSCLCRPRESFSLIENPSPGGKIPPRKPVPILGNALVLARCNSTEYLPDASPVFTRSRINRSVKLFEMDVRRFYELD